MTAEQFVWAWIKSEFILPKKLLFVPENWRKQAEKAGKKNEKARKRKGGVDHD